MPKNRYRGYHPRGEKVEGFPVGQHPLYHTHANMLDRCLNPKSKSFPNYGGRGVLVCDRWLHFANFVSDMGPKPTPFHTLERKNNDLGYSPENCVWASRTTQAVNRRVFENNMTGNTGVVKVGRKFCARFDYEGARFDIGRYQTLESAAIARAAFVEGFLAAKGLRNV